MTSVFIESDPNFFYLSFKSNPKRPWSHRDLIVMRSHEKQKIYCQMYLDYLWNVLINVFDVFGMMLECNMNKTITFAL